MKRYFNFSLPCFDIEKVNYNNSWYTCIWFISGGFSICSSGLNLDEARTKILEILKNLGYLTEA